MRIIKYFKSRGFTDRLYLLNLILTWTYTIISLILTVFGRRIGIDDYSFISIVCPLIWADFGVHTGFIIHKAKVENLKKNIPPDTVNWNGNIEL